MALKNVRQQSEQGATMTNQPEALRLADDIDLGNYTHKDVTKAAAELRRLHEVNQVLKQYNNILRQKMMPIKINQPIFELPVCDVCNKPVEYMDGRNDINFDARIFRVSCHGETQEVALTAVTMLDCEITPPRAFVKERLL